MTRVIVTKKLGPDWATDEQFAEMSDAEIIDLIRDDVAEFLDGATWLVQRLPEGRL